MTQEPLPEYLDYHAAVPWLIENADEKKTFEGNRTIVTYKDANPNYLAWKVSEQLRYEELKSELSAALKRCDEAVDHAFQWENEVRILREALEFYANEENYNEDYESKFPFRTKIILDDRGQIAKQALQRGDHE